MLIDPVWYDLEGNSANTGIYTKNGDRVFRIPALGPEPVISLLLPRMRLMADCVVMSRTQYQNCSMQACEYCFVTLRTYKNPPAVNNNGAYHCPNYKLNHQ